MDVKQSEAAARGPHHTTETVAQKRYARRKSRLGRGTRSKMGSLRRFHEKISCYAFCAWFLICGLFTSPVAAQSAETYVDLQLVLAVDVSTLDEAGVNPLMRGNKCIFSRVEPRRLEWGVLCVGRIT